MVVIKIFESQIERIKLITQIPAFPKERAKVSDEA
jgi:hypothetical protein